MQTLLGVVLEAAHYLAVVVHPLLGRCARVEGDAGCDCLSITLLQIVVSIPEADSAAVVLHERVEPRRLRRLPALLPRVGGDHVVLPPRIVPAALQMLSV